MNVFMIGICGTAMGNLGVMLNQLGHRVYGSDKNIYPPMSDFLSKSNIQIYEGFEEKIPPQTELVIIGNAISRGNPQAEQALREKMKIASMPQVIGEVIMSKTKNIVVTGTHGKTTTTAMVVSLLRHAGLDPGFLIGGISTDLGTGSHLGTDPVFVIEGDEYDSAFFDKRSKFVHYSPDILVINNIEFDHADIFDDIEDIIKSFRQVINIVPDNGVIIANGDDSVVREVCKNTPAPLKFFGVSENNHLKMTLSRQAHPLAINIDHLKISLNEVWGGHNGYNAAAAVSAALSLGIAKKNLIDGLIDFKGVERRMQKVTEWNNGALIYQDFAHHPTAIKKTLAAFRSAFPGKRIIAVLEPRSNTMVRNYHQKKLVDALSIADHVFIGELHRLNKIPLHERLNRDRVLKELKMAGKSISLQKTPDEIFMELKKATTKDDLVVVMSNGSFGGLIEKLKIADKM